MIKECLIGNFIKHKHALDVCYYVKKIIKHNDSILYSLGIWNMGFEKSWYIQDVKVENIELDNFEMCIKSQDCLRYDKWNKIIL